MSEVDIQGKKLTNTQLVEGLFTGSDIGTWQAEYLLREVEFERLKNGRPVTYVWTSSIFLTTIGYGLNLLGKGYSDHSLIAKDEWIALGCGCGATLVLFLIGLVLKDKRKEVMDNIEKHFESAPTKRQIMGGNNEQ
ncbi:hypothetical protein HJ049_03785 [Vibrio parahaemolyticus]|nr:hypothetical protein [Vibrio alginolyticus]MBE5178981.1 hypothetical protein [Vibrio parahaemolyticus]